jgi:membrane-associated protease RseP (regulator of RpoE activity)
MDLIYVISGWLFLIAGLAISIGLHELGHMWPAKKFGVKVTKYMIGFGPTLFSRKRGETEYGIKAIPLGGYIQMVGMVPPSRALRKKKNAWQKFTSFAQPTAEVELAAEDEERSFYLLRPWQKLIVMFGGPFANLLIAIVLALVLFCGFGGYERSNKVQNVVACIPTSENPQCDAVGDPSPAAIAGLKAGDKITSFNGKLVQTWLEIEPLLAGSVGKPASIEILRSNQTLTLTVTPVILNLGEIHKPYLGVRLESIRVQQNPIQAVGQLGALLSGTAELILQLPNQAFSAFTEITPGSPRNMEGAISIVGLGQFSGELASNQSISFEDKVLAELAMLMSLNVALFVFNMVPLVPLDGGHIAGALYEWVKRGIWKLRGKKWKHPVDTGQMMPIAYFVAVLLLALTVVLVVRDIVNPLQY